MVLEPYVFWEQQRRLNPSGLSWNSLAGYFMLFVTQTDLCRYVLSENGPHAFQMILHPNGWKILGRNNIAFKWGEEHKRLRQSFLRLFTPKALGVYVGIQERLIREHLCSWLLAQRCPDGYTAAFEIRTRLRDLNLRTSQTVFVGPYLRDRDRFCADYLLITQGFLSFPLSLPGTGLWRAIQARKRVLRALADCVRQAKERLRKDPDAEPRCLLDFWTLSVLEEVAEARREHRAAPKYSADHEMADSILDFLFAAQDASTASLVWTTVLVAERPDVLCRVREEQERLRPHGEAITHELLEQMVYTRAVILEVLRFRPPPVMVPQIASRQVSLPGGHVVPKGALVVPSLWSACMQGFPSPERFDPDRMLPPRQEDQTYRKHFLTFGCGPHMCVGRNYAINHLMCYLAVLSTTVDWTRVRTAHSDEIIYLPTIYPADSVIRARWRDGADRIGGNSMSAARACG
jgi:cytochrome P450 family 710 subfamily A protein